eukprot:TRINITY_DN3638_c0_g1_i2.p1 TRINITY_DN3638_c0_g1~~TRINITY_DN3638_c0_g1_i2.p1  ORF type:complete len:663 (+),score=121.13 TRINITY_DN3638_c0_g1_i2:160-2148(+)
MLYSLTGPSDSSLQASVGNGYIATVIGSDTQYIAGVYNGLNSVTPSHRARIPATTAINITNAQPIGSALDLERGIFYRRSMIDDTIIEQRWYAHRSLRNLLVHELEIHAGSTSPTLQITLQSGPPSEDFNFYNWTTSDEYVANQGKIKIAEETDSELVEVAYVYTEVPSSLQIGAGAGMTFYFLTASYTSLETSDPLSACNTLLSFATNNAATLLVNHTAAWADVWSSRIEVSGDLALAQAINSSLYYILSSVRSDWSYAPSPGGLASNGYNGHAFWDAETWMYPTFVLMYPDTATSFINYRKNRMDGAMLKAQSYNPPYQGTMYPWESAFTGQETCPLSAPTGQLEQHISGDIAFALEQYWRLSGDMNWLQMIGYPMLQQIANFWMSRVKLDPSGEYVIDGVIPPDEYAVNVNNSVYTNVVAQYSLQFAYWAGEVLNLNPLDEWLDVASKIKIPFDNATQIHLEYDGYDGQTIKQADVVLLGYPLMYPMSQKVRYNDLVYYSNKTDPNGPAMTWGMYAVAWLELGNYENAADIFARSYANIHPPFNVWTETPTGGTVNFITGAGGFLQALWAGWGGLRVEKDQISLNPTLPPSVTSFKLAGVQYLGAWLDVEYNSTTISFNMGPLSVPISTLYVTDGTSSVTLDFDVPVTFPLGPCSIQSY